MSVHLFLEVPVVQDHSHRDYVGLRQRFLKEIAGRGADPVSQPGRGNVLFRYRLYRREVETDAGDLRMFFGDFDAEQSSCTADIAEAVIAREVEFVGERFEVYTRKTCHSVEEAFELFRFGVQFIEYVFASVLGFVLRFPGAQRFRQIIPVLEQPRIEHLGDSADVTRAVAVEI